MGEPWRVFESAERGALRARLEKDSGLGEVLCKEAVRDATRCVSDFQASASARVRALAEAMRGIEDAMVGYRDAMMPSGNGMRQGEDALSAMCGFLLCLEERRSALEAASASFSALLEQDRKCRELLALTRGTVLTVRTETDTDTDECLQAIERAEAEHERIVCVAMEYRGNVLEFLSGTMVRFSQKLQESVDFAGKGEACDLRAVAALCDALLIAAKNLPCPSVE